MAKRAAKFVTTSIVTGVLSLGFAVATHAADTSAAEVDNYSTTVVTTHKTQTISVAESNSNINNDSDGNDSTEQSLSQYSNDVNVTLQSSVSSNDLELSNTTTSTKVDTTATDVDGKRLGSSDSHLSMSLVGAVNPELNSGSFGPSSSSSSAQKTLAAPTPVTPEFQARLQAKMSQLSGGHSAIRHAEPSYGLAALDTSANLPDTPVAPAPAKDLPIQGALAGISNTLSNITLPTVREFMVAMVASLRTTITVGLILAITLISLVSLSVKRRFVDELKSSGYSHAARADVSDSILFATPTKVSFAWAVQPSQKLTFFGVRNKVLTFQIQ